MCIFSIIVQENEGDDWSSGIISDSIDVSLKYNVIYRQAMSMYRHRSTSLRGCIGNSQNQYRLAESPRERQREGEKTISV